MTNVVAAVMHIQNIERDILDFWVVWDKNEKNSPLIKMYLKII